MRAAAEDGASIFRGSISRRFTVLSVLLLVLVAIVGGLSVQKARRITRLHTEIQEQSTHIEALDRLENTVFHLRAETQDALYLGEAFDDPNLTQIPRDVQELWKRFEEMHSRDGVAWKVGTPLERALYQDLDQSLSRFLEFTRFVAAERKRGAARVREAAATLHIEAHRLAEGLQQLSALHRDLMAERSRGAGADMGFILWTYGIFIALLGLTVVLVSVLFVRRVALPLRRLNAAALDVAGGNLSRQVPVASRDEIGMLTHTFNRMAEALSERDAQVRRRAQEMETLSRICTDISSMLKLDRLLQTIVESARAMLRTDVAALCLLRDGSPPLDVVATTGPWKAIMGSGSASCPDDPSADRGEVCLGCQASRSARRVGHLSARLKLGEQVLGALCVGSGEPRAFSETERELLGGLAAQAAIAIGNARLYERVRGMAAVEERERLAREMHDGLAQALGFLNLKLSLTDRLLDGGPGEPVRRELAGMRKVAGEAYEEVRQAIFGLRTMVSRGLGLVPTLSEYLHEFSQQAGIQVRLKVSEEDSQIRFAPEVEVQLIRIVQEALNNVRKHAAARSARVRLWQDGEEVLVAIEDDGVGFDPAAPPTDGRRHYGLASMRERAESVGGSLTIRSAAGEGSQVVLRLPSGAGRKGGSA